MAFVMVCVTAPPPPSSRPVMIKATRRRRAPGSPGKSNGGAVVEGATVNELSCLLAPDEPGHLVDRVEILWDQFLVGHLDLIGLLDESD